MLRKPSLGRFSRPTCFLLELHICSVFGNYVSRLHFCAATWSCIVSHRLPLRVDLLGNFRFAACLAIKPVAFLCGYLVVHFVSLIAYSCGPDRAEPWNFRSAVCLPMRPVPFWRGHLVVQFVLPIDHSPGRAQRCATWILIVNA